LKENSESNQEEHIFLLVNDNEKNILVFPTITNLKFLSQVVTILVDGTFKSCLKLFTQFFYDSRFIKWKLHTISFFY